MSAETRSIEIDSESQIAAAVVGAGIVLIQACAVVPGLLPCLLLLLPLVLPLVVVAVVGGILALPVVVVRRAVRAVRGPSSG